MAAAPPAAQPEIVVDESDEADSALGEDAQSTTTSLAESVFNYRKEHGRTYHAYKDGQYWIPNDDRESDRLDLQHHLFNLTLDSRLYLAPLRPDIKFALDIGTGTGIWAMDFADEFPDCNVTGTDLSPTQPSFVPPNLRFLIEDAEDEWLFGDKFDYIHARLLSGSFKDWPKVIQSCYDNLVPGGYLELQDYDLPAVSNDGTTDGTDLVKWCDKMIEATKVIGRPIGTRKHRQWMEQAGFVDIEEQTFVWPTNPWPKSKKLKELGRWTEVNLTEGLEGFSLALFTRVLGWSKEEVEVLCAKVRNELHDRSIHAFFVLPVIYGRRPL